MQKNILIAIVIAVLVGTAAFFGGMKYQQSQAASSYGQFARGVGRFGGRTGGMATIGKIVSSDNNSITVQLQDGSSKIVNISGSTKIVKSSTATQSDLTNGTEVAVFGMTNSDGSVTAQNVQINPANGMMRGMRSSTTPTQ